MAGSNALFSATISSNGFCSGNFTGLWQHDGTNILNIITTIAGNGTSGYSGDGGQATNAELNDPNGVFMDALGNLYIADAANNRVRKVDANGIITTVAGNGTGGYGGDGYAATDANLNNPTSVAVDYLGNLYICDQFNNVIRKVDSTGRITTFAGGGYDGGTDGYGDGGEATDAYFNDPSAVTVDALGNVYISDNWDSLVRKVDTSGIITVVAGTYYGYGGDGGPATSAQLSSPNGLVLDALGNLYISDSDNDVIRRVDTNGIITTVAGNQSIGGSYSGDGGAATNASLSFPNDVGVDSFGNLYIADFRNNVVREVNSLGIISTVAGNGTPSYSGDGGVSTNAELQSVAGVDVEIDNLGDLYVADAGNAAVRRVDNMLMQDGILALQNVTYSDEGLYQAIVTSETCGSITSAVSTLTILDTNGISYDWEIEYFGQTGLDQNADPDGNGQSLLFDYLNGFNPTDYYDGVPPVLTVAGGNYQCGSPSSVLPNILLVQVKTMGGAILTNAPLVFTVTQGELEISTNGPQTNSLAIRTDANGMACVYYTLPALTNLSCYVMATAWSGTNSVSVTFKEHAQTAMIAIGNAFGFYLKPDGHVLAWGDENLAGAGGDLDRTNIPTEIPALTNIVQITASQNVAAALDADGTVWTWGNVPYIDGYQGVPVQVSGITNVVYLSVGSSAGLAVESNGTVWGWGILDPVLGESIDPTNIPCLTNAIMASVGGNHFLVLLSDHSVVAWGQNYAGQLGDGTYDSSENPIAVTNLNGICSNLCG